MKCLTMQVDRIFTSTLGQLPGAMNVAEYDPPHPQLGITVEMDNPAVRFDNGTIVNVSSDLIRYGLANGDVVYDRYQLRIFRASVRLGRDGNFELIPEHKNDKENGLVYFDVGSGRHAIVDYESAPFESIASGRTNYLPFLGGESVMLAMMKPGSTIKAHRASKRWIFWGKLERKQSLAYTFDKNWLTVRDITAR